MNTTFYELFHRHIAESLDKQLQLNDLLQKWGNFACDMQQGKFILNQNPSAGDIAFDIQALGSEGADGSWWWIWGNTAANLPDSILRVARDLRKFGMENGIAEFTEPSFMIDYNDPNNYVTGSSMAAVAACMFNAFAYVPMAYEGGNNLILISTPTPLTQIENPIPRICAVFPQLLDGSWVVPDCKLALQGYLTYYGLDMRFEGPKIVADHPFAGTITATFDASNRLVDLAAATTASAHPSAGAHAGATGGAGSTVMSKDKPGGPGGPGGAGGGGGLANKFIGKKKEPGQP